MKTVRSPLEKTPNSPPLTVFVATEKTQGKRKNDFSHVPPGELLTFGSECDGEAVDGNCGCRRALVGVKSCRATTTFLVTEMPITFKEYCDELYSHLVKAGWIYGFADDSTAREEVREMAIELNRIASVFDVGSVVEKRGNKFRLRREPEKE